MKNLRQVAIVESFLDLEVLDIAEEMAFGNGVTYEPFGGSCGPSRSQTAPIFRFTIGPDVWVGMTGR